MHFLFSLGHPAHFHLFHHSLIALSKTGHKVSVLIKKKDILEDLLIKSKIPYFNILPEGRKNSKHGIALGLLKRDARLFLFCLKNKPDLMIGTSTEIGHVGALLQIPSINVNEDDADVVPLYSKLSYPWASCILSPIGCNNSKWEKKTIKYPGYHELCYLHPQHFKPQRDVASLYVDLSKPYFLVRFAQLTAHHDIGIRGITDELAIKLIDCLLPHGNVYITSERQLNPDFEKYRLKIDPLDIHHVMAFAEMYIGDSQTMAAEAGVLGIPFIRYNDFVGRIGYLNDLEINYNLGYGIIPKNGNELIAGIQLVLNIPQRKSVFQGRREKMLSEKINSAEFITWFIENYPKSLQKTLNNPNFNFSNFSE